MSDLFATIVADPPWEIAKRMGCGGRRRNATEVPYTFLTIDQIKELPVGKISAAQAHLYLWCTRRHFREGIAVAVARAWGFEPRGELIWGLRNPGMGGFNGNGHEPILLATRGGLPFPKNELPASVCFWKQPYAGKHGKIHSAKPDGFIDLVERISPAPRIELFARNQRLGWATWGSEAFCHVNLSEVAA